MTEPFAFEDSIIITKNTASSNPLPAECQHCEHQSIGQCNEANADNMMDYSECLDMMRHQIIMLQEREAPVNVVSVDNPWQEWWRIHPWKHMAIPHRRHEHTAPAALNWNSKRESFINIMQRVIRTRKAIPRKYRTLTHAYSKAEQANPRRIRENPWNEHCQQDDYTDEHDVT